MKNSTNLIFDFDGVLLNAKVLYAEIAFKYFGNNVDQSKLARLISGGGQKMFDCIVGRSSSQEDIQLFRNNQVNMFKPERHLYPNTHCMVKSFSLDNNLFIVSNKPERLIKAILEKSDLTQYFQLVIGLDSGFQKKPSPEGLNYIKKMFPACDSIFVGDAKTDFNAARNANMRYIHCNYGYGGSFTYENSIDTLSELNKFLIRE